MMSQRSTGSSHRARRHRPGRRSYAALERIGSEPGRLDALVNNAGVYGDPVGAADYDLDRAHEVLEVNTFGPWRLIEAFLPLLASQRRSRGS